MPTRPALTLREYRPGDETEILATFNRVFAAVDPGFEPRDERVWRWQFLGNPSGWRILVAATPEGRVVAQYAGIGQRARLEGRPARFSQSVDSMSDPTWSRGLRLGAVFMRTGLAYAERYGGTSPEQDTLMWGLPVPAAWRIGSRRLDYRVVRTQGKLVAPSGGLRLPAGGDVSIAEVAEVPEDAGHLFERCASERGAIALRDREQLDWRFVRAPHRTYRIAAARRSGELAGLAVFRVGTFEGERAGLVCDWLTRADDDAARAALLDWSATCAGAEDGAPLLALLPDTAPEWLAFQEAGFRVRPTRYALVGRSWSRKHSTNWLRRNWYYTLGDSDLC